MNFFKLMAMGVLFCWVAFIGCILYVGASLMTSGLKFSAGDCNGKPYKIEVFANGDWFCPVDNK